MDLGSQPSSSSVSYHRCRPSRLSLAAPIPLRPSLPHGARRPPPLPPHGSRSPLLHLLTALEGGGRVGTTAGGRGRPAAALRAHRGAAGAGQPRRRDEGERRRGSPPRHQGRQRLQEGPQRPHRAELAPAEGAGAGAAVPGGGPEHGGGGAGGCQEGVRREGQGQPPQGHHRQQGLPPAAEEQPRRARTVLLRRRGARLAGRQDRLRQHTGREAKHLLQAKAPRDQEEALQSASVLMRFFSFFLFFSSGINQRPRLMLSFLLLF
uniref:VHA-E2 n=1 Tax=Arundo donax TaxID=35708 RepID=A0A0A9ELD1_ARUDO